jgi:hypothetical protein
MPIFDKPHIDISNRVRTSPYQAPRRNMEGGSAPRIRAEHGARILAEMRAAFTESEEERPHDERLESAPGIFVEVELQPGTNPEITLDRKRDGVRTGAVQRTEDNEIKVALFVPDGARPVLEQVLEEYREGDLNKKKEPPKKDRVEPIESIRRIRFETFWTDELSALPTEPQDTIWWEAWCYKGMAEDVREAAGKIDCVIADQHYWLHFPETTVIQIKSTRVAMELLLFATAGIAELRRASATPVFFLEAEYDEQIQWTENLAERVVWPNNDAPAVCLLDTGINRGHMLIEPALAIDDLLSINNAWGSDDHDGHGTGMAGLTLLGDLFPILQDTGQISLRHRLESVKILPPGGFPQNDPQSYGSITQSAVSLAEVNKPERSRIFCTAITNKDVSGARASTWSAAVDQASFGLMPADEDQGPKRLFVISAGNIPPELEMDKLIDPSEAPIEDPAQAWNALTVGGYTDKTEIDDEGYEDWQPLVEAGDLSPFSRTSITWPQGKSPNKPDLVMEAGNRAVSPAESQVITLDSLSLLTTGEDIAQNPIRSFSATSAAAAQAARLCASISATYPAMWPETIRALMVHSAEWTPRMLAELNGVRNMTDRYPLLRKFGHGVPSLERALASANNHLALLAQNEISPFSCESGKKRFGDSHYYRLPWPKELLEGLGEQDVRLKIALSYFIEPNPGRFASIDAQRYQSFGLRFDMKRRTENEGDFLERTNALNREDPLGPGPNGGDNQGWMFGPNSISAGSLHCDEWQGPAVQLASRNMICIKPVTGWWKDSAANCRRSGRYALIVTLSAPNIEIDLHTPIATLVENRTAVDIRF